VRARGLAPRRGLDRLHAAGAVAAGVLLVLVAVLTLVPIAARLLGLPAHSWDEVATFCMAGAAFMGLACTWRAGGHVRMELLVTRLTGVRRRAMEVAALLVALAACGFFSWHALAFAWLSYTLNDVSQGLLPIPLWIPQSAMVLGLLLLSLAVAESLVDALAGRATAGNGLQMPEVLAAAADPGRST
jgi:TRAP-type C4-dicarboxylate transport system permease small subunit